MFERNVSGEGGQKQIQEDHLPGAVVVQAREDATCYGDNWWTKKAIRRKAEHNLYEERDEDGERYPRGFIESWLG